MKKIRLSTHRNSTITLFICCLLIVVTATSNALNPQNLTKTSIVSWSNDIMLSENDSWYSFDPKIAVNDNYIHVVWADNKDNPEFFGNEIYYRRSSNYGKTWDSEIRLIYSNGYSGSPVIGVNGSNIHIAWRDSRSGTTEVYYKRSIDNGDSWGPDVLLSEDDGYMSYQQAISVSNSNVHVVWKETKDFGGSAGFGEIYYKRSINNGDNWDDGLGNANTVRRLTNDNLNSCLPITATNNETVHVFWSQELDTGYYTPYYSRSENNGKDWAVGTNITPSGGFDRWVEDVVIDGDRIYVVGREDKWVRNVPYYSIWFAKSEDNGETWSSPTYLAPNSPNWATEAHITVKDNMIFVVWYDNRSTPDTNPEDSFLPGEVFLKLSNDYGSEWSEDVRITYSDGTTAPSDIAYSNGFLHLIMGSERTGTPEVFYKRSPDFASNIVLTTEPNVLTADGATVSTITATVTNKTGLPIQGLNVNFNIEAGSGTLLQSSSVTDSNGIATATFVAGTMSGEVVINVSCDGIWNKTTITLLSGSIKEIKINPEGSIDLYVNDTHQFTVLAYDQYGNINTSWQPYWHVEGDIGTINETGVFRATKKGSGAVNCTDNVTGIYNITIINVLNRKPILGLIENQTTYEGRVFTLQINATDLDGDTLTFSDNSTLFDINLTTGLISFVPSYDSAGVYYINITVSDGEYLAWRVFKLTIINVNRKPTAVISSPSNNVEFTTKDNIYFDVAGSSDPDNDSLTYTWTSSIDGSLGEGKTLYRKLSKGTHIITLTVEDVWGESDTTQATITVKKTSEPSSFIPTSGFVFLILIFTVATIIFKLRKRG